MFSVRFVIYSQGSPSEAVMFLTLQISLRNVAVVPNSTIELCEKGHARLCTV